MKPAVFPLLMLAFVGHGCINDRAQAQDVRSDGSSITTETLKSFAADPRVQRFYVARNWLPAWPSQHVELLLDALGSAEKHGLTGAMFLPEGIQSMPPAQREAALTLTAITYADALVRGRINPKDLWEKYTIPRPSVDIARQLNEALEQERLVQWFDGLAPQDEEYRRLSEAYLKYQSQASHETLETIPAGALIKQGNVDFRVPSIAERLRGEGYLTSYQDITADRYTLEMAEAVRRLQADHGIKADGVVGADTLQVLNTGAAERARQLAVNLELRRWLNRTPPATRIDVNTAAATLDYWHGGIPVDHRRVVVGQPDWETPQLSSAIFRLVANPTWTVPKSIERSEMAAKGANYLRRNNMVRRDGWIVQLPGPDNALGQVKFDMRNDYAIYLHDTPAQHLFESAQRHRSHGCVRVEDAAGFARILAEQDGSILQFEEALANGGEESFVALSSEIPVRLIYHTAYLDENGGIRFLPDIYGWDAKVAEAMNLGANEPRTIYHIDADLGP
ncbi:MAG TPA: L,D-transpeptidase family protein [Rhizorhapis sp.]